MKDATLTSTARQSLFPIPFLLLLLSLLVARVDSAAIPIIPPVSTSYLTWKNAPSSNNPPATFFLFDSPLCPAQQRQQQLDRIQQVKLGNDEDEIEEEQVERGGERKTMIVLTFEEIGQVDFDDVEIGLGIKLELPREEVGRNDVVRALRRQVECETIVLLLVELTSLEDLLDMNSWIHVELLPKYDYTVLSTFTDQEITLLREEAHTFRRAEEGQEGREGETKVPEDTTPEAEGGEVPAKAEETGVLVSTTKSRAQGLLRDATNGWLGILLGSIWLVGAFAVCRRITRNINQREGNRKRMNEDNEMSLSGSGSGERNGLLSTTAVSALASRSVGHGVVEFEEEANRLGRDKRQRTTSSSSKY